MNTPRHLVPGSRVQLLLKGGSQAGAGESAGLSAGELESLRLMAAWQMLLNSGSLQRAQQAHKDASAAALQGTADSVARLPVCTNLVPSKLTQ